MKSGIGWLGVAVLTVCGALSALIEALLVPFYVGSTLLPIGVAFAVVSNILLPRLAFVLVPRTAAAACPFVGWLVVIVAFGLITRPEGDVILPGGSLQWASYAVLLGGALVGTITVLTAVPPVSRRTAPDSPRATPPRPR